MYHVIYKNSRISRSPSYHRMLIWARSTSAMSEHFMLLDEEYEEKHGSILSRSFKFSFIKFGGKNGALVTLSWRLAHSFTIFYSFWLSLASSIIKRSKHCVLSVSLCSIVTEFHIFILTSALLLHSIRTNMLFTHWILSGGLLFNGTYFWPQHKLIHHRSNEFYFELFIYFEIFIIIGM